MISAEPAKAVVATASQAVQQIPAAIDAAKSLTGPVGQQLQQFTTPEGLLKAAGTAATPMVGGALLETNSDWTNSILFGALLIILGGGAYMAMRRLNIGTKLFSKEEKDDGPKRNDTPPQPSSV